MIKKILPILLACTFAASAKESFSNSGIELKDSLLWKITGNEITEPSYLYGTMHLMCDTKTTDKAKVQKAADATTQLYLEVDMSDPKELGEMMKLMNEEVKIKDLKDQEKKQQLLALVEKHLGMKSTIVESTTVFGIFSMMAFKATDDCALPTSAEDSLEAIFKDDNTKISGLETMAQQMQFLRDSDVASLDNTIIGLREFDEMKDMYDEMTEIYMNEDVDGLYDLMTKPSDLYTQEYIDNMMEILLEKRNKNWVKQIPEIANQTPTFFGVGAGHLGGKNGVINLLRLEGYSVEAVMDAE